jgi:hypothetical protein
VSAVAAAGFVPRFLFLDGLRGALLAAGGWRAGWVGSCFRSLLPARSAVARSDADSAMKLVVMRAVIPGDVVCTHAFEHWPSCVVQTLVPAVSWLV